MAIARQTDAAQIKPLQSAIVRRFTAGATIAAGEIVSMQSDGFVDPASAATAQTLVGIALAAANSGERVDVVVFGPVTAITGGTPGATCYASDTAGEPAESQGTTVAIAGFVEAANIVFVRPELA